jgi:hypothetical protein
MRSFGGDKSPMQMYHGWFQDGSPLYDGASSTYGPAPGYLEGGPNQYFSLDWIAPPYGQPRQKAYKDWNTAWNAQRQANENSWEITEPAIYYQAAYTLLLSQYATDTYAPTAQGRFSVDPRQTLMLQFSEDIGTGLTASDLRIDNLSDPGVTPTISTTYDPTTRRATMRFAPGILPDGNYRVTLVAGGVSDAAGNPAALSMFDFFVLAGDANRDRKVDFLDLVILAQNYGAGGQTFASGDFNYDGDADFEDLVVLAQRYGTSLAAAGVMGAASSAESIRPSSQRPTEQRIFSTRAPIRRAVAAQPKRPVPFPPGLAKAWQ